jgi:hypothetical protein
MGKRESSHLGGEGEGVKLGREEVKAVVTGL